MKLYFDNKLVLVTPVGGQPYETHLLDMAFTGEPGMDTVCQVSGPEAIFPPDAPADCGYQRGTVTELDGSPINLKDGHRL